MNLLSANQVAQQLGQSPWSVLRAARDGELACVRLGRRVKFLPADVTTYIESRRSPVTAPEAPINWSKLR